MDHPAAQRVAGVRQNAFSTIGTTPSLRPRPQNLRPTAPGCKHLVAGGVLRGGRDGDSPVGFGEREETVHVRRPAYDAEAAAGTGARGGGQDDGESAAVHEAQPAQVDGHQCGGLLRPS